MTAGRALDAAGRRQLETFLTWPGRGPVPPPPPPDTLRAQRLAAYAAVRLPADHPLRDALRPDHAAALYTHLRRKAALRPLLAAWQDACIPVLLFKGFQLAEFVYPSPGQRSYGDVDVMLPPEHAPRAAELAAALGWQEAWRRERSMTPFHHELMTLLSPDGSVQLDVHERLVHNLLPRAQRQQAISQAVWRAATPHDWDGLQVRLPTPADAVLAGLVLNRCWSDDSWRLDVHDLPDFTAIVERSQLSLESLRARARELGCARTLELFLRRCSPYHRRLRLRPRRRLELLAWGLQVLPERGVLLAEHRLSQGWVLGTKLADVARELPGVLRVLLHLRRSRSLPELSRRILSRRVLPERVRPATPLSSFEVQRVIRGVHLTLNLLRVRPGADCLPRALAIAAALRRRGCSAQVVSGVRRDGVRLLSHAWVEVQGEPIFDAMLEQTAAQYTPNYRTPQE